MRFRHVLPIAVGLLLLGCNVLRQQPPATPRYYLPEIELPAADGAAPLVAIRLGRITSAPFLRDRMLLRLSDVEIAFDEVNRWAVPPELLAEQALYVSFSRRNGFALTGSPSAPQLEIRVLRFEELAKERKAWVVLDATVQDRSTGSLHWKRAEAFAPLSGLGPEPLARGIGRALGDAIGQLAGWVRTLPVAHPEAKARA